MPCRGAGYGPMAAMSLRSTYTLNHDPTNDILKGVYYQAVMQQKFDVYFTRAKQ